MDTCRASTTKYFGEWVCKASRRPSVALSWGKSMPSLGGAAFASGVRAGTGCWWKEGLRCLSSVSAPWQMLIGRITSSSSHFNWVCPVSVGILWMLMSTWGSVGVLVSRNVSFWCVSPVQWRLSIQTDDDSQYLLLYEIYQDEEMPLMLSWQGLELQGNNWQTMSLWSELRSENGGWRNAGPGCASVDCPSFKETPTTLLLPNPTKFNYVSSYQLSFINSTLQREQEKTKKISST